MKYFILLVLIIVLLFIVKKIEKFSSYDVILERDFPHLIKDESEVYLQKYQCLDYDDIRI